jgi:hypothetical protein
MTFSTKTPNLSKSPTLFRETPKRAKLIGSPTAGGSGFRSMASLYLPRSVKIPKKISEFLPEGKGAAIAPPMV